MDYLKRIDMFGAPLTLNLDQTTKYHKTRLGGFSTFVVYSLVLTYAIMNLRSWSIGDLLPTITTQRSAILDQHIPVLSRLQIDMTVMAYNYSAPMPTMDNQFFSIQYGIDNRFTEMNSNISYSFVLDFNPVDNLTGTLFYVLSCNPQKIINGKCADNNTIFQYLQQNAYYFQMEFNLTYINPNNFEVTVVKQIAYTSLEQGYSFFNNQSWSYFVSNNEYQYSFTAQKQYIETQQESYGKQSYQQSEPIYGSLYICSYFSLDFVADLVLIQYPSIFTILGNIGAIGGILLYFKHVIFYYNSQLAEKLMIDKVIRKVYPRYQQIKLDKTNNLVRSSSLRDQIIEADKFKTFEQMMKLKIYDYFSLPQMIINQIEFHHFIKEIHPNYQYAGFELESVLKCQGAFDIQQVADHKIFDLKSCRQVEQEPQRQAVR